MDPVPAVRILEWYRADAGPRMRRALLTGPLGLSLGGGVIAVAFLTRASPAMRGYAAAGGFAMIAASVLFTLVAMSRILRDDSYLALRTDGLLLRADGRETLVVWDGLDQARWDAARSVLVLSCTRAARGAPERAAALDAPSAVALSVDEAPPAIVVARPFAGIAGPALAARIEQTRRRAAMGWLR